MLCIKTKLKPSKISGIGLFADEPIMKGAVVWKFEPSIDILLSEKEISNLSEPAKEQFYNYAYLDNNYGKYLLCGDDARFFNHSDNPNCNDELSDMTIAERNIMGGEELTVNYKKFYGDINRHPEIK